MTTTTAGLVADRLDQGHPQVALCGTFRRHVEGLKADRDALRACGCEVISPIDIEFVEERDGFVVAEHEADNEPWEIEEKHLGAMLRADFIWFHAPDGYVGKSGAMELGFAHAHGIPVFSRILPMDVAFRHIVTKVAAPAEAVEALAAKPAVPAESLARMQHYYRSVARSRGYGQESLQDSMLLLTEEVGELARAIRKHIGLTRDTGYAGVQDAAAELADVQLYLLHLANILNISLPEAVQEKESINAHRFEERNKRLSA